ncbi:UNVERIFIED_CONTAM: hypothetical protein RMT77_011111 [Armadillidium vulgare]
MSENLSKTVQKKLPNESRTMYIARLATISSGDENANAIVETSSPPVILNQDIIYYDVDERKDKVVNEENFETCK